MSIPGLTDSWAAERLAVARLLARADAELRAAYDRERAGVRRLLQQADEELTKLWVEGRLR